MSGDSDAFLVERAKAGDRSAFERLFDRHWERIYVLAAHSRLSGFGSEDIVQETFLRAYRKLHSLRRSERFGAWIFKIALTTIALKGRATRTAVVPLAEEMSPPDASSDPAAQVEAVESHGLIREAVASLPDHYRVPVVLRFFDGMSCGQIADCLGLPVGTVWARLHRAIRMLRERLDVLSGKDG